MSSFTPEQEKSFLLAEKATHEKDLHDLENAKYTQPYSIYKVEQILDVIDDRLIELGATAPASVDFSNWLAQEDK